MVCLLIVVLIMFVLVIIVYTTKINSFFNLRGKNEIINDHEVWGCQF